MNYFGKNDLIIGGVKMNNKNNVFDEMQQKVIGDAGVVCTVITFIYLLVECVYKYVKTKDIFSCTWELGLLILISLIFYLFVSRIKEMNIPKTFIGRKELPTDNSKESKKKRVISYLAEALAFSVALSVITFGFSKMGIDIVNNTEILIDAVGLFAVAMVINFIVGEYSCNKYEIWKKSLDDEDE